MKCENREQLHAALDVLIQSSAGATREALTAIKDYVGREPIGQITVKFLDEEPEGKKMKCETNVQLHEALAHKCGDCPIKQTAAEEDK
jgi:hypothetical protein